MATTETPNIFDRLGLHLRTAALIVKTSSLFHARSTAKNRDRFLKKTPTPKEMIPHERRIVEQRVVAKIPVRYRAVHDEDDSEIAFAESKEVKVSYSMNVSSGGMYIATKEELPVESLLRLHIFPLSASFYISTLARIMWTDKGGAGVCFEGMRPKEVETLKEYIRNVVKD
jgi:hypothetical protein